MTTYTLAQIIQGEAATPAGQFAVASTIFNRANSGQFGSSDPLAIANAPGQFTGHLNSPSGPGAVPSVVSPNAQSLGDALQNGTLTNYGDTGNALYFQSNQGQPSTVVGGSSVNIGGNYFSDQPGQPSPNFVAPAYGANDGAMAPGSPGDFVGPSNNPNPSEAFPSTGGSGSTGASAFDANSSFGSLGAPSQTSNIGTAAAQNAPALGVGDTSWTGNTNPIVQAAAAGTGLSAATAPQNTTQGSGGGTPINITDATNVGTQAANTVSKALGGVTSGAASDTTAAVGAGTSWLNSIFGEGTDLLARGGFILLGLFMLIGAFVFFYVDSKTPSPA